MNPKVVIMLAFCFSLISLISASATLEIQTLPNHEIFITEIDAYSGSSNTPIAQPFSTFTGDKGKFVLDYTPQKPIFKLGLLLKDNNGLKSIGYYVFDDELLHDGKFINITFLKDEKNIEETEIVSPELEVIGEVVEDLNLTKTNVSESNFSESNVSEEIIGSKEILNSTIEEETKEEIEAEDNEKSQGILMSGYVVYKENKFIVNIISYILGAVVLVAPVYMLLKKRRKNKKNSMIPEGDDEKDFEKAEEDLEKARERIDALKGKKITAARQKLIEDERELMRLRKLGK